MAFSLADNLEKDLQYVFSQKPWTAVAAQDYSGIRFVAKQRMKKDHVRLLFDGRHLKRHVTQEFSKQTIYYFLLDASFNVLKAKTTHKGIPTNHRLPKNVPDLRLHQLLDLDFSTTIFQTTAERDGVAQMLLDDPRDFQSTLAWLEQANLNVNVMIFYCFRLLPKPIRSQWIKKKLSSSFDWIVLEAFTGANDRLQFRQERCIKFGRPKIGVTLESETEGKGMTKQCLKGKI